ncbi:MAG: SLC26A/SulP transporter family protein, partial [Akkermansiaceae bacterium]|nr:SLC26A/SulP transporter family protein [Verrucomicrobiales bacterium]
LVMKWLPGVLLGLVIFLLLRRFKRPILVPGLLVGAVVLFYCILLASGSTVAEARTNGWLPAVQSGSDLHLRFWDLSQLRQIQWASVPSVWGLVGTVLLTAVISILLNSSGLELVVHQEIDLNRELRAAGVANIATGFGGGMLGFQSLSLSRLAYELGSRTRWTAGITAALCAGCLFLGPAAFSFLPGFVPGGLLLFLGLSFLVEWLYDSWFKIPLADYVVVVLILGVIGAVGYLEGVGFGVLAAVFLFIHNYSRVAVITHVLSGADQQSNVDRPVTHQRMLREKGQQIYVLKLQGFIFFGTANTLLNDIRQRAENRTLLALRFVVLDFRRVSGIDSSAVLSLAKARQVAEKQGFVLVLSHLPPRIRQLLLRGGFERDEAPAYRIFPDLDHSIEWCEAGILKAGESNGDHAGTNLRGQFSEAWPHPGTLNRFLTYLDKEKVAQGQHLIRQGNSADALYFLESGEVTTMLESANGGTQRLRRQSSGTVVGELGLFLGVPRTASVIANEECLVYRLSASALQRMKGEEPHVAADFYEFMVRILAERVVNCNKTIRTLSE